MRFWYVTVTVKYYKVGHILKRFISCLYVVILSCNLFMRNGQNLTEADDIKVLGVQLDNHLTYSSHTDLLLYKLSTACFIIRLFHLLNSDALRITYVWYFHSLIKHGTIFGCTLTNIGRVFLLHKRTIRIRGVGTTCSCKGLFKNLDILPVPCLYIYILWWRLLSTIMGILKLIHHYTVQIQDTKINYIALQQIFCVFKKGLLILVQTYLIVCLLLHWNYKMTHKILRLHYEGIFLLILFILLKIFFLAAKMS